MWWYSSSPWMWWGWEWDFKERMKQNGVLLTAQLWNLIIALVGYEFIMVVLAYSLPTLQGNLAWLFTRPTVYMWAFFYFIFVRWLWNLNLNFIEKFWGLSIILFFFMWWSVIWNGGLKLKSTSDFGFSVLHWLLWENGIIFLMIGLLLFFIVFIISQLRDILNFLENSWWLDKIKWLFGIKKQEEAVEEVPVEKPKTVAEKIMDFTNQNLEAAWFRVWMNGANAYEFKQGINWMMVFIDPKGRDFAKIIEFCNSTLWEKSQKFETEAEETTHNGKRVILVTFAPPVDVNDKDFLAKKFANFEKYGHWLNFLRAISTTPDIKQSFNTKKEMIYFGVDRMGKPVFTEFNDAPHFLVTWETKGWKSVLMHSMIMSPMLKMTPDDLQIALADPKQWVEFGIYQDCPFHKKYPLATNPTESIWMVWLVFKEYERRIPILRKHWARNIWELSPEVRKQEWIHYVIVMVDEYAEIRNWDKVRWKIFNAQMERAAALMRFAWIHLIVATQKADADIISPVFKSNLPIKLSLKMNSSSSYYTTFWQSPWKVSLQGYWDCLMLKGWVFTRFQGASMKTQEIIDQVKKFQWMYPNYPPNTEEERKQRFIEWMLFIEQQKDKKSEIEEALEEKLEEEWISSAGSKTSWAKKDVKGAESIMQKDFEDISDEVKNAIEELKESGLGWYVDASKVSILPYMDSQAQKMISFIYKNGWLSKEVFKPYPTISNKAYVNFRNFLIHSGTVTVLGADENPDLLFDPKQTLIPTERASTPASMFLLLGQMIEKQTGKTLITFDD